MSRIVFRGALICALACLPLAEARPAHAGNQVVGDCGDNGGANQLRAKLNAAQSSGGGTLTFTCGPTIVLNGTALPNITTNISINGANAISLSGNHASRLFYVNPGATLTLNDLTITNGDADFDADGINDGGAIYSLGTLNIHNSIFLNNLTTKGNGGALIAFGALNVTNSEFGNNKALNGGALYPTGGAAIATVTSSRLHHNQATDTTYGWGGAVYLSAGAAVTVATSTVMSNTARQGGGVYVYQTSSLTNLTVNKSTLSGNAVTANGGGIANFGTLTMTNSTLSGNLAGSSGGGMANSGTATLLNVTLSGNSAQAGGAIFQNSGPMTVWNSIVANSPSGGDCVGSIASAYFNLDSDGSCTPGPGSLPGINPRLGPLRNNGGPTWTHALLPNSPAIDRGSNALTPPQPGDQRGFARIVDGNFDSSAVVDMGAFEFDPPLFLPLIRR